MQRPKPLEDLIHRLSLSEALGLAFAECARFLEQANGFSVHGAIMLCGLFGEPLLQICRNFFISRVASFILASDIYHMDSKMVSMPGRHVNEIPLFNTFC